MRAESPDGRGGHVPACGRCGRRFRSAYGNQGYRRGRCENVARGDAGRRPVDVYLGTRSEPGREVDAMRSAPAEGRCV